MDADTFVTRLQSCSPSEEEAREIAEGDQIRFSEIIGAYVCSKRPNVEPLDNQDPIIALFLRYDPSSLDFGMITFRTDIQDLNGKLWFGHAAGDWLVIDQETRRVQLLDHSAPDYVVCECARDAGHFLDAMIAYISAPWMEIGLFEEEPPEGPSRSVRLAEIAGGSEFLPFYESILGLGLDE